MESPSQVGRSGKMTLPSHVISSGGSMLYDSTVKTATVSMSREIFLVYGNTGLCNRCRHCKTVRGIFLRDLSTLSHILFLRFTSLRCLPPEEACHWILSRLRLPAARLSATHDDLRVATLLQIMFAAVTPVPLPPQRGQQVSSLPYRGRGTA